MRQLRLPPAERQRRRLRRPAQQGPATGRGADPCHPGASPPGSRRPGAGHCRMGRKKRSGVGIGIAPSHRDSPPRVPKRGGAAGEKPIPIIEPRSPHGQGHRNRPRHHQLSRFSHGGWRPGRHPQRRGRPYDPVGGRLHQGRRAPGRPGRASPSDHQPQEHDLLDQALHGPQGGRSEERGEDRPVRGRQRLQRAGAGKGRQRRQDVYAAGDLGDDPAEDEADRRGLPGPDGHAGGDHRAGVLQRRPAAGHQRRRQDRRPRGAAHHQRANGRGAGVRTRQKEGRKDRGLRSRRRHLRHFGAGTGRGRLRGQGDQRRHAPRRRRLRPACDRLAGRGVQKGAGHRPFQGRHGAPAAQGGRGKGEDGVVDHHVDRHQPAVHHGDAGRSQAPQRHAEPGQVRVAGRRAGAAHDPADEKGAGRRGPEAGPDRRGDPGRRLDADPEDPAGGEGVLRQGPPPRRQPGRGRGDRRGDPGRRAGGRRQGRAAARRDPALARHRDAGRRVHPADHAQHHDPDQEERNVLDRRGQPDHGRDPRASG